MDAPHVLRIFLVVRQEENLVPLLILPLIYFYVPTWQWISEASRHFGGEKGIGHKLASAYYGSDRGLPSRGSRGLVVTTYGVVASDYERGGKKEAGLLYSVRWRRIVLDEAVSISVCALYFLLRFHGSMF